jgi:hypothetical protein
MSGLTKPSERLREYVEPAFREYLQNPLSQRHANILAGELDNHLEWTYKYHQQVDPSRLNGATLTSFRTELLNQHRALQVISDLADAARHRYLDRAHDPPRVVTLSTAAYYEEAGVLHVKGFDSLFSYEATKAFEFWRNWRD